MVVVWGQDLYGTVDRVPGFFSIATRFFHVYHVPIFPLSGHLILKRQGKHFSGIDIPLNTKSVLMAYGVGFLPAIWVLAGICTAIVVSVDRRDGNPYIPASIAAVSLALWIVFMILSLSAKANYKRACQMALIARLNEQGWKRLNAQFGRQGTGPIDVGE